MKVRLLARKGNNKAGSVVEYNDVSAEWLIAHGFAERTRAKVSEPEPADDTAGAQVQTAPADDEPEPAPRRGRPRKTDSR